MDGRWLAFAATAALAAAGAVRRGSRTDEFGRRLDLTGDQPLTLREARKLKRWWEGAGWSAELFKVRPDRFRVIATKIHGSRTEQTALAQSQKAQKTLEKKLAEVERLRAMSDAEFARTEWMRDSDNMLSLAQEIRDEEGHYGKGNTYWGGQPDSYELNIKTWAWAPSWVGRKLSDARISDDISDERMWELDWFTGDIMDKDSPLYQPWYHGEWTTAGRSGGYLLLKHNDWPEKLDRLADEWPGKDSSRVLGGWRFDADYLEEVKQVVADALEELAYFTYLQAETPSMLEGFSKMIESDEWWQDRLGLTNEEVERLKAVG